MSAEGGPLSRRDVLRSGVGFLAFTTMFKGRVAEVFANTVDPKLSAHIQAFNDQTLTYLKEKHAPLLRALNNEQKDALCAAIAAVASHMQQTENSLFDGPGRNPKAFAESCLAAFDRACTRFKCTPLGESRRAELRGAFEGLAEHLATFSTLQQSA